MAAAAVLKHPKIVISWPKCDHYAIQGHSSSTIFVPIESCNFLLVINTSLPPILHRCRDMAFDRR